MNPIVPILYSFRRCPYAIRTRLALKSSGIKVELREVVLSEKPAAMLSASPKGTVPVLVLTDGSVIDESLDILLWALRQNDPDGWLSTDVGRGSDRDQLIQINDGEFKFYLDRYKYWDRYPEHSMDYYRQQAEIFLQKLEQRVEQSDFVCGDTISMADMAIFPFIRQFSLVDKDWFEQSRFVYLRIWLDKLLSSELFISVMKKYPQWHDGDEVRFM